MTPNIEWASEAMALAETARLAISLYAGLSRLDLVVVDQESVHRALGGGLIVTRRTKACPVGNQQIAVVEMRGVLAYRPLCQRDGRSCHATPAHIANS